MIKENIPLPMKRSFVRSGDAGIFGEDSNVRRMMTDAEILERFAQVWKDVLEHEIQSSQQIPLEHAREMLDGAVQKYAVAGYQYREFSIELVAFIAQLNLEAENDGECTQLWFLGVHRDPTRLCMFFDTPEDRKHFESIARGLKRKDKDLAAEIVNDFMRKFPQV